MPANAMRVEEIMLRGLRFWITRHGRGRRGGSNVVVIEILVGRHVGISGRHEEIVVGVIPACRVTNYGVAPHCEGWEHWMLRVFPPNSPSSIQMEVYLARQNETRCQLQSWKNGGKDALGAGNLPVVLTLLPLYTSVGAHDDVPLAP
jgi:hypothetical protein